MKENSKTCPRDFTMATALLETGSGNGSTPDSADAASHPHKKHKQKNAKCFFIASKRNSKATQKNNTRREQMSGVWSYRGLNPLRPPIPRIPAALHE
jgi:hypothetical protein